MRHKVKGRKFNRDTQHRRAMFANLAIALITHEQIKTTLPKAKDLRPYIERLVTKARSGSLHNRRVINSMLRNETATKKLVDSIAPRFSDRPGGYTRILKAGFRHGDNAAMAMIAFVEKQDLQEVA
jgi:large subunit ribosomal protein L17